MCRGCCLYSYIVGSSLTQKPNIVHVNDCMKEIYRMNDKDDDDDDKLPRPSNVNEYGYFDLKTDTEAKKPNILGYNSIPPNMTSENDNNNSSNNDDESNTQSQDEQNRVMHAASNMGKTKRYTGSVSSLSSFSPCSSEEFSGGHPCHDQAGRQVDRQIVNDLDECRIRRSTN